MKTKQKRKMYSRALSSELKAKTNKTRKPRKISPEHALFDLIDNGKED